MKLHLEIWRQAGPYHEGHFEYVTVEDAVAQMSILELLDHVNSGLIEEGKEPFAFASDCREGICGTCWSMAVLMVWNKTSQLANSGYSTSKMVLPLRSNHSVPLHSP